MKNSSSFVALPAVSAAFLLIVSCAPKTEGPISNQDDGFIDLFNGKDLSGWTENLENESSFAVVDGAIKVDGARNHLFYSGEVEDANFTNFELHVIAKTQPNANAGIFFHTRFQEKGWPSVGYEAQVNASHKDPKKTGSIYNIRNILTFHEGTRAFEPMPADKVFEKAPHADGEWFDYKIRVNGKKIETFVNGEQLVDYTEDPADFHEKFPERKLSSGTFAIQAHDPESVVFFKSIRIKPLP